MKKYKFNINEIKYFILLWITQSLSTLGSSMTSFALIIWSYKAEGSALSTALLAVCSYAPYVLVSIFVGAISDKINKKAIMLISDTFSAVCTLIVLVLVTTGKLELWHLYILNALNGLMNSFQQPAFDVTVSLITPKKYYQKTSGMRIFTNSLNSILAPIIAITILSFTNINIVILVDLVTFLIAAVTLLFFIKIPKVESNENKEDSISLLLAMSTENFFLAFGNSAPVWCIGTTLGWLTIPIMSTNMDVLLRNYIPISIQGRVYAARNSLQYFTIPLGYILGGFLVDKVFEPIMSVQEPSSILVLLFGSVKGSGAAFLFFFLGILGVITCVIFRLNTHIWKLEN